MTDVRPVRPNSEEDLRQLGAEDADKESAEELIAYQQFISSKRVTAQPCGFSAASVNPMLFDFQADIVRWALKRGRAAIFADCGLGKTPIQLEWGRNVSEHSSLPVLIFAPLAVSQQTVREGAKFGIPVTLCETSSDLRPGVNVTNYEKMHHFSPEGIGGLVLDESSILKGFDGKTRKALTVFAENIPYRLACTATPAPNDYMELGNHAEWLGVMKLTDMLSMFFVHDGGDTSKWRLKGHAETEFWKWLCSWAVAIRKPSDLGYEDDGFKLPPLHMDQITVEVERTPGYLFPVEAQTLQDRNEARRDSIGERVAACAALVNGTSDQWLIWCNLNSESVAVTKAIYDASEVTGSDSSTSKEQAVLDFIEGRTRVLASKPTIFGYGLNLQNCHNVAFLGLSDSYEQFYQAIRRCWRFGQSKPVQCHVITADTEGAVVRNIRRKEQQSMEMMDGMVEHMQSEMYREIRGIEMQRAEYATDRRTGEGWTAILGDCVEQVSAMESESIGYSVFSPPFASLYTYSNSERDMGNAKDYEEFEKHFRFLIPQLFRVLIPGRLLSFHCMNLPLTKERDGIIGIRDFRGELIRMFESVGFVYHSEVTIWKDPVTAMQRTKAIGLLYKQLKKDSAMSRQGIPDYLVTMRKPGVNPVPVTKTPEDYPVSLWQNIASPVWMDINPSDTLQRESAREERDERHICPLQLEVIRRAVKLWTVPGDVVLSPFMGIGSEGYVSLELRRRFMGVELKRSYWEQACRNLAAAENAGQGSLFQAEATA